jgi:hypothetical protein
MANASFDVAQANRWFAVETNNLAWDLLESGTWTDAQSERMIDAAHAAAFHWSEVGTPLNYLRAQTLLTTMYARLGFTDAALRHAAKCRRASESIGAEQTPWDRACVCAATAEAHALAGDTPTATALKDEALKLVATFENPEDAKHFRKVFLNAFVDTSV